MTTTPTIWKSFTANLNSLAGVQLSPAATALADGRFLVTWTDDTSGASPGYDQFAQFFDAEGNPKGQSFQLNTASTANGELKGKIAALPDGGFIHIYASSLGDSDATFDGRDLTVERRNAFGTVVFTQTLHDVPIGFGYDVAVGANGDYSVQFTQYFDSPLAFDTDLDAFGFIYDFETNVRGERFSAGRNASESDLMEGAAGLSGGGFASVTTRFVGDKIFVVAKAVDGQGHTILAPFTLGEGQKADIAALTGGNFAVTYQRGGDIFFRVISPEGGASPELAAAQSGDREFIPTITQLQDGGFFIAWFDFDSMEIRGQRFDASGTTVGGVVAVASGLGFQELIEIDASLTTDGRILLSFSDGFTNIRNVILDPREAVISGTGGDDVITTRLTATEVFAGEGNDKIFGQKGADIIHGGGGHDIIRGGGGIDTIDGGAGNDVITLLDGHASDHIDGGIGQDVLDLRLVTSRAAIVDLEAGRWAMTPGFIEDSIIIGPPTKTSPPITFNPVVARAITGVEYVIGTQQGDLITGSSGDNKLIGNGGNDRLSGGGGRDALDGSDGNDTLDGGTGDDRLFGQDGADDMRGGAGADLFNGGAGFDIANYLGATAAVTVALDGSFAGTGDALGDIFNLVENIRGSNIAAAGDVLRGDNRANLLLGLAGNDTLDGGEGGGADKLGGGRGIDIMTGRGGDDTFFYNSILEGGDRIADFHSSLSSDNDVFAFRGSTFGGLSAGGLAVNQFEANTAGAATLATTRFVFDTDDGILSFDADGAGAGAAVVIATIQAGAGVVIDDIAIF